MPYTTSPSKGLRVSGREKLRQQMAAMILAAEKDRQDADWLFRFLHFEPIDGPVNRQVLQTWQQIIVTLTPVWRRTQPVGDREDIADAGFAMIQRSPHALTEAAVTLKQVVEDQGKITLGLFRKLNSEPQVRGACQ